MIVDNRYITRSIEDELDEKKDPLRSWIRRRRRKGVRVTAHDVAKSAVHLASCPDNIVTLCSNQGSVRGLIRSLLTVAPKFINNLTWLNVEISFTKRVKQ